ncbi:pentapeptide repeat-containing protein [Pedobacter sp. SD-b]|uniref:Pentapeptide repeat-containing protein n=1 Tax=Pedobacter segetis TaxID=2793069 RepID=A0ABS1BFU7_9SPHI|nr:pentapeptide repeat-containing protein [Pedobacter segetis]MBK0381666.1 pentapeptide repeat-containing protein [Pedobacter segetis]
MAALQKSYFEELLFEKRDFAQDPLDKGEYELCEFKDCNFGNADLFEIVFTDSKFIGCNFTLANIAQTAFRKVKFKDCKLLGLHFDHCNPFLLEVGFENCNLNLCSFYQLKLKSTIFINCTLHEADFSNADLTSAKFDECDLLYTKFDQTTLEKADFSTAFNYQINPEGNRIKKAKFSLHGLPGLLANYDILVDG